jgi:excisionase family DNA binding protein
LLPSGRPARLRRPCYIHLRRVENHSSLVGNPSQRSAEEETTLTRAEPLTYSIREAAFCLGVHELTVRAAIARGDLRTVRLGRRVLIPRTAIAELLGTSEKDRSAVG